MNWTATRLLYALLTVISGWSTYSEPIISDVPEAAASAAEARADALATCRLPSRWEGNWFQSGVHVTITINRGGINIKGRCLEADGEKYLLFNEKENCYRCVVFHEKHTNVLQYKETLCLPDRRTLKAFCSTITGDASLFSLFRMEPSPIDCPFGGSYTFTYNRGQGECKYPLSTVESCIHPSRVFLNFQACPDVPGTESTVEELQCLATWKEGSSRFLLGLIQYRHYASYEERFRCFTYERTKRNGSTGIIPGSSSFGGNDSNMVIRLAQSGDATCNGLTLQEGSRTMTLRKASHPKPCQFPSWLQSVQQWHTLDLRSTYVFDSNGLRAGNASKSTMSDLRVGGGGGFSPNSLHMTAYCHQILDNPTLDRVNLILHSTVECRGGYMCTAIYKRDGHIVEMQFGTMARSAEDACQPSHFNQTTLPYVTLVSSTPETRQCPYLGRFQLTGVSEDGKKTGKSCVGNGNTLRVGCNQLDTLQLQSDCSRNAITTEYACHGWWEEMGVSYLITTPLSRSSTGARRYCFVFRDATAEVLPKDVQLQKQQQGKVQKKKTAQQSTSLFSLINQAGGGGQVGDDHGAADEDEEVFRFLQFSSIVDSCRRNVQPGIDGSLAFNASQQGQCNDTNGTCPTVPCHMLLLLAIIFATTAAAVTLQPGHF